MFGLQTILSTLVLAALPAPQDATLLFVTTPGCEYCKQITPLIKQLAEEGYSVQTIDAPTQPDAVKQLQVRAFPTFLMLSGGNIVDRIEGGGDPVAMKPRILQMFQRKQIAQTAAVSVSAPHVPSAPITASTMQTMPQSPSVLMSSVKLRVDAANAHSWGTGTIIDTRAGEALILTCGHIFRDSQGKGDVEVHLFGQNSDVKIFGTCLYYDLEIDLALITIKPPCLVKAVPIAPNSYPIQPSQDVVSVGCDNGGNPTARSHKIMSTNRVGTPRENAVPFHYIQVSGAPVSGRSGGGLFSKEGHLIGVCNTADPVENDGHFVPPQMIRYVLDKLKLAEVYQNPSLGDDYLASQNRGMMPSSFGNTLNPPEPMIAETAPKVAAQVNPTAGTMSREELATLEEIKRRKQDGDEVIMILRSRRNPEVPSDVIILNGTSDQFMDSLVKNQPENDSYNSVIFSSHETPGISPAAVAAPSPKVAGQQPVSFPVIHH
jgi:thiol-disulfide isomerase/thioredoxin